mmetsp:Transcript_11818/g.29635  ORF Transcript_11818/g.29635 Transcript_11818/m.29635 type:complete len:205 (-) Transcript_11818:134-748(-)
MCAWCASHAVRLVTRRAPPRRAPPLQRAVCLHTHPTRRGVRTVEHVASLRYRSYPYPTPLSSACGVLLAARWAQDESQSVRFGGSSFKLSRTASRRRVINCMCSAAPGGGIPCGKLEVFVVPCSLAVCSMNSEASARPSTPLAANASAAGENSLSTGQVVGHGFSGDGPPRSRTKDDTSAALHARSEGRADRFASCEAPTAHLP